MQKSPNQNASIREVGHPPSLAKELGELLKKFEKENGEWKEGFFVSIDGKRGFSVYHRFFPNKPYVNWGRYNFYIEIRRKYASIDHTYNGFGWNQPYRWIGQASKVPVNMIILAINESRNAEELYYKIAKLFDIYGDC